MSRLFFEEKQSLREVTFIWWIIVPVTLSIIIAILYGVYWQLIMGEPLGNEPMSNKGLLIGSIFSCIILGVVIWLLLSIELNTSITKDGIRYNFYPHMHHAREIGRQEIQEYSVVKLNFFESRRRGYRKSLFKRSQRLIVNGRDALVLVLKTREKLTIGTQKPAELEVAVKRMMATDELE